MAAIALSLSALDAMRVPRGHCLSCEWCPRFVSLSKRILCDYCGCPPAKHDRLDSDDIDVVVKKNATTRKKMKLVKVSSSGTPSSEDDDEEEEDAEDDDGSEMTESEMDEEAEREAGARSRLNVSGGHKTRGFRDAKYASGAKKAKKSGAEREWRNGEDDRRG